MAGHGMDHNQEEKLDWRKEKKPKRGESSEGDGTIVCALLSGVRDVNEAHLPGEEEYRVFARMQD